MPKNFEEQAKEFKMFANRKTILVAITVISATSALLGRGQSTATLTQQVNQRNTIGVLVATPATGITFGSSVNFAYQMYTAGAPAPTADTVQFFDGSTAIGSPVAITEIAASNLLPYSQVNTSNGWTTSGTPATVSPNALGGPDGSSNTASSIGFPDSTSAVLYAVPSSTIYAGQTLTLSFWVQSPTAASLTMGITDSPHVSASRTGSCIAAGGSTWQRCTLTYAFPAGNGFAVSITSAGASAQSVNIWGAQVEEAAQAGPYVSTIGTAWPTGAQAGTASLAWSGFLSGSHSVTVAYAGDANYVASTSNAENLSVSKGTASAALGVAPSATNIYGQGTTFSVNVSGPGTTPTGTVQLMNGGTVLGTGTISSGIATITLVGAASLPAGTYSITAVYSGDANFSGTTSAAVAYAVTQAPATVLTLTITSSLNPSVYGDPVSFTIGVSSSVGVTPTGTVTLNEGSTVLGTGTLGAGAATIVVLNGPGAIFNTGSHSITATYSGDTNYR
jgi:hypothetical protein